METEQINHYSVLFIIAVQLLISLFCYLNFLISSQEEKEKIKFFRKNAREALKGHWGIAIGAFIVFQIIFITAAFFLAIICALLKIELLDVVIAVLGFIIICPLYFGYIKLYLELSRGKANFSNLFQVKPFFRNYGLYILAALFQYLWTLLFIVPGIIKTLAYSQVYFIRCDNPQLSALDTINLSREMIDGYKLRYIQLWLSFLPWYLLCIPTLGILLIYVIPYVRTSCAEFYKQVSADYDKDVLAISK